MKTFLILLILSGQLLTVTAPQSISAPNDRGVLAQMEYHEKPIVYAHSYLSGTLFYDLRKGDIIPVVYNDGEYKKFVVTDIKIHISRKTKDPRNFDLLIKDEWIPMSKVLSMYTTKDGLLLVTCYSGRKGNGISVGRVFIMLMPVHTDLNPERRMI